MGITDESRAISFKNILFAMDFSAGSLRAFPFAAGIALQYSGKIFVEHIAPAEDYVAMPPAEQSSLNKLFEAAAQAGLYDPVARPREGPFDHGGVSARLLAAADKCKVDLIVIGTHGWRGIRKLLRGSTAEEIACLATKPVLTVGPEASGQTNFRRVLYAADLQPTATPALPFALSFAQKFSAELLVLHVNDWNSGETPVDAIPRTYQFVREHLSGVAIAEKPRVLVDYGPRAERILEHAITRDVDLIVMGLHHRAGVRARIAAHLPGSTAYDVIAEAHCPVLTVPTMNLPKAVVAHGRS